MLRKSSKMTPYHRAVGVQKGIQMFPSLIFFCINETKAQQNQH